jgi:hypothetical protein
MLTALGISIALLLMFELSHREKLALLITGTSCFLTSLSFFIEILIRRKRNETPKVK